MTHNSALAIGGASLVGGTLLLVPSSVAGAGSPGFALLSIPVLLLACVGLLLLGDEHPI